MMPKRCRSRNPVPRRYQLWGGRTTEASAQCCKGAGHDGVHEDWFSETWQRRGPAPMMEAK